MSWEDDADLNQAYLEANPAPAPRPRARPFDVQRGMMEEPIARAEGAKSGVAAMKGVYETKTGQSGEFDTGPMSLVRKYAIGKGKRKTRRGGKKTTSKRSRGRSRYASGGSRKGKSS